MRTLIELWPIGLESLRFTLHLRAEELDWQGLSSAAKGWATFRVERTYLRATIPVASEHGDFHGHFDVSSESKDGYSVVWTVATGGTSKRDENAPDLMSVPALVRPFVKAELSDLRGILVAFFRYGLDEVTPSVKLPIASNDLGDGPVIAGLEFEFPESSQVLRRAFISRLTESKKLHVTLMLRIGVNPVSTLIVRMTEAAAEHVRAFVQLPSPPSSIFPEGSA